LLGLPHKPNNKNFSVARGEFFIKKLNSFLWKNNKILKLPITIDSWYGRLGNNIQQISLALLYAKVNGFGLITPDHPNIDSIKYGFTPHWPFKPLVKNRFFFFNSAERHSIDIEMSYEYVCENISSVAQRYITPNLKFQIGEALSDDILVIHLRGGDVYLKVNNANNSYVQNPLSFYEALINRFNKTIVVCEPGYKKPIVAILKNNPSVIIQSSSVQEDFSTLIRARNLATSGVGTFAITAALCSKNIKRLFCTDRYLTEHLNPEMVRNAKVHCINLGDQYIPFGSWTGDEKTIDLMLNYKINDLTFRAHL
jgi:hypothetical protein